MKTIMTAAQGAGAQDSCVRTMNAGFQPILRRELLRAIRTCRSRLGLSTGDVLVLDTLLSFLPCRDRATGADLPINPEMVLVVYASNRSICERANGMDERVLRRHVSRLVSTGLLRRHDSATGKRFALRTAGKVRAAFGLDLTPLLCSAKDLQKMAKDILASQETIRSIRAEALAYRAALLRESERLTADQIDELTQAKTHLRRATLTEADVARIRDQILALCDEQAPCPTPSEYSQEDVTAPPLPAEQPELQASETSKASAGNGQTVRQVESKKIDTFKNSAACRDLPTTWAQCPNIREFLTHIPRTDAEFHEAILTSGKLIALKDRTLAMAAANLGWSRLLQAIEYLIASTGKIRSPEAYMRAIIEKEACAY
ncbi:plasmid replication protein RepC [Sagittula sp. SSi028]|uniref:plasmid replication protein RepC n=1 Tax=Sagittula sp. SSi028 TaxID=3400636 RepID=UPI003AF63AB4